MRTLLPVLILALVTSALPPTASAGTCVGDPGSRVCVGYTVISSDCRFGAITVNGIFVEGYTLVGEVFWEVCWSGLTMRGHSIEALSAGWYDYSINGERTCAIYAALAGVPMDCAYGPPYLPMLP